MERAFCVEMVKCLLNFFLSELDKMIVNRRGKPLVHESNKSISKSLVAVGSGLRVKMGVTITSPM